MTSNAQFLEKPLPSSSEAERAILGGVLLDNTLLPQAIEQLLPEHFYSPRHRSVYKAMIALFERQERIDPILVGEEIRRTSDLESIGGISTITNLTYGLPHFSDITHYVKVVREKSNVRDLVRACGEITATALAEDDTPEQTLAFAQTRINEVCTQEEKRGFVSIAKLSQERIQRALEVRKGGVPLGLKTGLTDLDAIIHGLQKTDLIIIGARPGMGKSSLVANISENVCRLDKNAVAAIFSLEMSKEQYTDRMLCASAEVDLQRFRDGRLTQDEWMRLARATDEFESSKISIDDTSALSTLEMRSKLMRLQAEQKRLDLVVVDFMQRMVSSGRSESRQQEVGKIARDLKSIAKDFHVPVIALSSLSRECESRNPPRPKMSDLRESGDIESEADIVTFIYRAEYYNETEENAGIAEIIIDKHRHGPTGVVKLAFMKEFTKFANFWAD